MCGIAGYYNIVGNLFFEKDLRRMTSALVRRGPDAEGIFYDNQVGLGHRRLSILDLSTYANQPMISQNDRYVIVFNGEIYNYRELSKEWQLSLKTSSDTEVLLEGFSKYGIKCLERLNGMFAFAIYDKNEETLFVFRDRVGIKPLYYHYSSHGFAFASETKALLTLNLDRSLDLESLKDYFFLEYIPQDRSIFKSIRKLESGHYIKISKKGFEINKYYDLLEHYSPVTNYSEEGLTEELFRQLSTSINYQSISDVPIGAFLSGGTDSSLICSVFQNQDQTPINTFTIGFDVEEYDERKYADQVASILRTNHYTDIVSEENSKLLIEKLPQYYDEPFAVPSMIPSLQVCKKARKYVKVALSGDGGDELFMGYGYYQWYNRISKIQQIGGYPARKILSLLMSYLSNPYKRASRILDFEDYGRMWLHIWSQEQYMFSEKEITALLGFPYKHETVLGSWELINKMSISPFEKISFFDIKNYLPNNLMYKMDIASMSHGLEVRVPYLDHNLMEFAMNVPVEFKIKHGESKYLMKKVLERYLPKELVYRKKWGFPAPVGTWLQNDLSFMIEKYLNRAVLERQGLFNSQFVEFLVKEFRGGKTFHFKRVWALLYFQLWYKHYIDADL